LLLSFTYQEGLMANTVATRSNLVSRSLLAAGVGLAAVLSPVAASAQTAIALGMSGWTGFAPLSLADKAGIFKKNGLDVELKMIPQKDRHLALASEAIQCAATTVETHVAWNANGVPIVQIFQMDKSYGADGIAVTVRGDPGSTDLGSTVGLTAPGAGVGSGTAAPPITVTLMLMPCDGCAASRAPHHEK
jgi:NitT/TauT family transport system substrate-binding protein